MTSTNRRKLDLIDRERSRSVVCGVAAICVVGVCLLTPNGLADWLGTGTATPGLVAAWIGVLCFAVAATIAHH
jgi:hypothetical protein